MGDQMEIDPDLYESSPQQTSYPLFAHREPPASLSSTKSFSYDGFTPVAHTATMRKGSASGSGGCGALSKNREKKRHNRGGRDDEGGQG